MGNSIGRDFTVTSFGESHGRCVGVIVDGCPAGLSIDREEVQLEVDKRKPSLLAGGTPRAEDDEVEIFSGIFNGYTTGAPICMLLYNKSVNSSQYDKIRYLPRPGHADFTAYMKYGGFNDFHGGGRFSGRITAGLVMAGAIAKKLIALKKMEIIAHTVQIDGIQAEIKGVNEIRDNIYTNPFKCADLVAVVNMAEAIEKARAEGDSLGGIVEGIAFNVPIGLGEPIFDTLEGDLAKALFAIPSIKGVEFGAGFGSALKRGSDNNDPYIIKEGRITVEGNNAGGILGGISTGLPIIVRVAVKPTPSISIIQKTVDMKNLTEAELELKGRHDVCIVPRAVPVVEAMMAVTICDFSLRAGIIPGVIK
ncbi:chorismate synthase [Chloroflexota bacterium]